MTLSVRFHPAARADLEAAVAWYDEQERGLGGALVEDVERAIAKIVARPDAWPLSEWDSRARKVVLSRFPYRVIYTISAAVIVIVAVAHQRRRPGYWRTR
ncbi:MAG: type II toxin-antitoxin system RelE/ParE family toxin [Deltaproteobacteria bacterium]|nr:type II toxin-antitoxin system RelE/ParE family toxin [Deltaproteobacteria bacterium]